MSTKHTFTLFLILIFFNPFVFSQIESSITKNSFFIGKRGAIEMGLNPRLSVSTYFEKFNLGYWGEYTYALSNSLSTTINAGRNTYYRELIDFGSSDRNNYGQWMTIRESEQLSKEMKTTRVGIRLNKSLSRRKGALAPMGHYIGAGVQWFMTSLDYKDEPLNLVMLFGPYNDDIIVQKAQIMDPVRFNTWTFDLIYGYRKNVSKNVFISWAFSTSLTSYFFTLKDMNRSEYYSYRGVKNDFNDIKRSDLVNPSKYAMRTSNFFNFNFGIGMILH